MYEDIELKRIHARSSRHRAAIQVSEVAGCFHCREIFAPDTIEEWWDEDATGRGQTAVCPHCGIDSVIGDAADLQIDRGLLRALCDYYF